MEYEERYLLFTGYGNDTPSDRYSLRYKWDFGDGNSTEWENNVIAGHAYPEQGFYRTILSVMDDEGLKATDVMNVTILNHPPQAQIDPLLNNTVIKEDEIFRFKGTGDDSPSDINSLLFRWEFGDGNKSDWADGAEINHSYTLSGGYKVALLVKDNNNDTANASINITIENVAPSGSFTPEKRLYNEDERIAIEAEDIYDTPSDLPLLNVTWLADNVTVGSGRNVSFSVPRAGPVIISFNIMDDDGVSFNSSERFIIRNIPPLAYFSASAQRIDSGQIIIFDAANTSDTSSDMDSLNYTWTLSDGQIAYGRDMEHRFLDEGIFPVKLTVIDDDCETDTYEMDITVGNIDSAGGDGAGDKGIGESTWLLMIFIIVLILILLLGIALFIYFKKQEKRSAPGSIEKIEEEVVEEKIEKPDISGVIAVEVKEEYEVRIEAEEDEMEGWIEGEEMVEDEGGRIEDEEEEEMEGWIEDDEMLEEEDIEEIEEWSEEYFEKEYDEVWAEEEWVEDNEMEDWFEEKVG